MRFLALIFAVCLAGCASNREVVVTPLPELLAPMELTGDQPPEKTPDYTINELAICEVHHIRMQRTLVPIAYGLILPDTRAQARYAASTNSFPHAETFVLGGCSFMVGYSATNAVIYACPACKKAAEKWDSGHDYH